MSQLIYFFILLKLFIIAKINCSKEVDKKSDKKRELEQSYSFNIYIDKFYLEKNSLSPESKKIFKIYSDALDKAKATLEKLIELKQNTKVNIEKYKELILNNYYVNDFESDLESKAEEANLIIFVKVKNEQAEKDNITICQEYPRILESNNEGRPIIGAIIIDDSYLSYPEFNDDNEMNEYKIEFYSYYFLHQMTHILGFNRKTLQNKVTFDTETIKRITDKGIQRVIIKCGNNDCNLMKFARKYFNCATITYLELEEYNNNEICSEFIHWDTRILLGDYMTKNFYIQDQVISEFTLYLLEETGFYKINNYTGGLMRFGKNANCSFFEKDCNVPKDNKEIHSDDQQTRRNSVFPNEFCSSYSKTTCSPGRLSRGLCENTGGDGVFDLDDYRRSEWNDFGNKYAEFCPISIEETNLHFTSDVINYKSYKGNCKIGNSKDYGMKAFFFWRDISDSNYNYSLFSNDYGEYFSDTSFCAFSSVIHKNDKNKRFYDGFIRPTCYQMNCSDLSLTIRINDQFIVCPRKGGYVKIGGDYEGYINCPDYNLICSQTIPCNNMFDCVEKRSRMKENYIYDYIPTNVSTQIITINKTEIEKIHFEPGYELSEEGGICPVNCSECYRNRKCFACKDNIFLGDKENDNNPINCSYEVPKYYFYPTNETHYFRCINNCKNCSNPYQCNQCDPKFYLDGSKTNCIERIEGCGKYNESSGGPDYKTNGGGWGYTECLECNNNEGYYCIDNNKQACKKIDIKIYFPNENGCQTACDPNKGTNCYNCTKDQCISCKTGFYFNNQRECLKGIDHCEIHKEDSEEPLCKKCEGNYRCLNKNQSKCVLVNDIDKYYYVDGENNGNNDCMDKCSMKHDKKCINCTKDECLECEGNNFVYNSKIEAKGLCIEKLDHCKKHLYDEITKYKYCEKCEDNYYCINNNKSICAFISQDELETFYGVDNSQNTCMEKCYTSIAYCEKCESRTKCKLCRANTNLTNEYKCEPIKGTPGKCLVKMHEINEDINSPYFNLLAFPNNYTDNFPNTNVIDHYVNKDYTVTVFLNSECTEELLNLGYFKIDSKELQNAIIQEFGSNQNYTYSVFVTHNFKSHFRYYDFDLTYLNITENSQSAKNKEYTITNKFTTVIKDTLGALVASLVESEKINIFERSSNIFNDYCQNVTFLKIDMPLKQRLSLLYTHKYSDIIACLGEDCELEECNYELSTCTCKCKIGNSFEDILKADSFDHYDGPIEVYNNFIDSIGIIKCTGNGFKNLKANPGFYLIIIGIGAQLILYILYIICGTPITKMPKGIGNPPKKMLKLFSDWAMTKKNKNESEGEVYIQPRDDDDEQLLEEEKSYSNFDNNLSNVSIDTNVGGLNLKNSAGNKLSEKPNRKILILLNNKDNKKSKKLKDYDKISSDSGEEIKIYYDEDDLLKKSFCSLYWYIVSLKQHLINYFSFLHCLKITKSFVPLTIQIIRSIFLFFLSFVLNILFLNQSYYEKKFEHFDEKYKIIHGEDKDLKVPTGERISYAIGHTFGYAMVVFILLIIANFLIGLFFFSIRKRVIEIIDNKKDNSDLEDLKQKQKKKNLIFFIVNIILMIIFLLTITAFVGAYGGGFTDYFVAGIISLIFLELFPLLSSLIFTILLYYGVRKKNETFKNIANFFMF